MTRSQPVDPSDERRFRTGRPCLDFAHTGGDGPLAAFELLHDLGDARRWLAHVLDLDDVGADTSTLTDVISLRRAIWGAASRVVAGHAVGDGDRSTLNTTARQPALVAELTTAGTARIAPGATISQALSSLARDAIDLLGGPLAGRVRACAAADCGLLYVDRSRPGTRRWCSMQRCGNLAKVREHRARAAARAGT